MSYYKDVLKPVLAEKADAISTLLVGIIGETVKGKIWRAILIGAVAAGAQFIKEPDAPAAAKITSETRQSTQPQPSH